MPSRPYGTRYALGSIYHMGSKCRSPILRQEAIILDSVKTVLHVLAVPEMKRLGLPDIGKINY